MAVTKVAVSRKILDWALARSGKSVSDLEPKFKKLSKWMSGEDQPSLRQLKDLANRQQPHSVIFFLNDHRWKSSRFLTSEHLRA